MKLPKWFPKKAVPPQPAFEEVMFLLPETAEEYLLCLRRAEEELRQRASRYLSEAGGLRLEAERLEAEANSEESNISSEFQAELSRLPAEPSSQAEAEASRKSSR